MESTNDMDPVRQSAKRVPVDQPGIAAPPKSGAARNDRGKNVLLS